MNKRLGIKICFWLSIGLGIIGLFITFYPGSEAGWFGLTSLLAVSGLFLPARQDKIIALVLLALWTTFAVEGFVRGIEYKQWLREHSLIEKQIIEIE